MVPEENGRNGPFTSDAVETIVNWANTMVGMAETWYRRPKRLRVGKRKKRSVHAGCGGNTCKLGEYDGRNGRNMVPEAETAELVENGRNGPFTSDTV